MHNYMRAVFNLNCRGMQLRLKGGRNEANKKKQARNVFTKSLRLIMMCMLPGLSYHSKERDNMLISGQL